MKLEISRKTDVDAYLTAHHYLHSAPAGARRRGTGKREKSRDTSAKIRWVRTT